MAIDTCSKCGIPIQEFLTGRKHIDSALYCKDCFYEEFGKVIEAHPIGRPREVGI